MEVMHCNVCKRLFNYFESSEMCPECSRKMDEKFLEVKEYIYNNPNSSLYQVSQEMEVSTRQLKVWIREERLTFAKESGFYMQCDSCGADILTGRYCKSCKTTLLNNLKSLYITNEESNAYQIKNRERMRFLGQTKKS